MKEIPRVMKRIILVFFDDKKAKRFILKRLDKILYNPDFIVADLGCGPGHILRYLSGKCKKVMKIEYAENMLKEAQRRNKGLTNITYRWGDLRNLDKWYSKFDIAIATNSILPDSITGAEKITLEIYKSLKKGGVLVAVMPSVETCNYLARLKFDRYRNRGMSEKEAIRKVREEFEQEKQFDGLFGFLRDDSHNLLQKYFYRDEVKLMFKKAGFKIRTITKLCYSWKHCKEYNYDYFPGADEIYDWFVIAEKLV